MQEIWKDIAGYEGYYQVSNLGRIKSLARVSIRNNGKSDRAVYHQKESIKLPQIQTQGYYHVCLYKDGKCRTWRLNRIVAETFIPNPENKPEINHIDGDKHNNCVDNLEWVTGVENIQHALKTGLIDRSGRRKPILQIDEQGNIVAEFDSIKAAAKAAGVSPGWICSICKGYKYARKTGGFYWRYKSG